MPAGVSRAVLKDWVLVAVQKSSVLAEETQAFVTKEETAEQQLCSAFTEQTKRSISAKQIVWFLYQYL